MIKRLLSVYRVKISLVFLVFSLNCQQSLANPIAVPEAENEDSAGSAPQQVKVNGGQPQKESLKPRQEDTEDVLQSLNNFELPKFSETALVGQLVGTLFENGPREVVFGAIQSIFAGGLVGLFGSRLPTTTVATTTTTTTTVKTTEKTSAATAKLAETIATTILPLSTKPAKYRYRVKSKNKNSVKNQQEEEIL